MPASPYRFGSFTFDPAERSLRRDGNPVELSGRYFDALALMVANPGQLVTKDRFNAEVWRGVPVTDEALTQCIRTLRRALGDDAAAPRFIETVPKHGYRFIAPVTGGSRRASRIGLVGVASDAAAGAVGGALAGAVGGTLYVSAGLVAPGLGSASIALALVSLCLGLGAVGGLAVALGWSLIGGDGRSMLRAMAGGGFGGLAIGALAATVGSDLLALLFGRAPAAFTGAGEAAILGASLGGAAWLSRRAAQTLPMRLAVAGLAGGAAGALIAAARGHLMAGSLAQLGRSFPESPLRFGMLSPVELVVATALEGALFCACVVTAIAAARRLRGG
jgi:DNA-binding winged helix-turn-helix (wHTH) protein